MTMAVIAALGGAADHGAHADHGEGRHRDAGMREQHVAPIEPIAAPSVAPMNRLGEKMPPEAPEAKADGGGQQLADEQGHQQQEHRVAAVEDVLDGGIADRQHLVVAGRQEEAVAHAADGEHADDVLPVGVDRQIFEPVLGKGEQLHEGPGGDAHNHAGDGGEHDLVDVDGAEFRHR